MTLESEDGGHGRDRVFTVREFCSRYKICRSKFFTEKAAGKIRVVRVGHNLRITHEDAEAYLANLPVAR